MTDDNSELEGYSEFESLELSSSEYLEMAQGFEFQAMLASSKTRSGEFFRAAADCFQLAAEKLKSSDESVMPWNSTLDCTIKAVGCGHWESFESLYNIYQYGRGTIESDADRLDLCKQLKKKWLKEIWDFYLGALDEYFLARQFKPVRIKNSKRTWERATPYGFAVADVSGGNLHSSWNFSLNRVVPNPNVMTQPIASASKLIGIPGNCEIEAFDIKNHFHGTKYWDLFFNVTLWWPDKHEHIERLAGVLTELGMPFLKQE